VAAGGVLYRISHEYTDYFISLKFYEGEVRLITSVYRKLVVSKPIRSHFQWALVCKNMKPTEALF